MNQYIGYCGLDCAKCDSYLATVNDDDALREKTAKYWSELNQVEIPPAAINCLGCRRDGVKTIFCSELCGIRKCALSKGFETCADCGEMEGCDTLKAITDHAPAAKENLLAGKEQT